MLSRSPLTLTAAALLLFACAEGEEDLENTPQELEGIQMFVEDGAKPDCATKDRAAGWLKLGAGWKTDLGMAPLTRHLFSVDIQSVVNGAVPKLFTLRVFSDGKFIPILAVA